MAENSKIEWTQNTGSPWFGCTEVSPGCSRCYARELTQTRLEPIMRKAYKAAGFNDWKTRPVWGDKATRVLTKGFWDNIKVADRSAAKRGERVKHFPSLMDWLDDMPAGIIDQDGEKLEPVSVIADFLKVIHDTPNTDHLLLTKRPENWHRRVTEALNHMVQTDPGLNRDDNCKYQREHVSNALLQWLRITNPIPLPNVWIGTTVEDQKRADQRIPELLKIPAKVRFLSVEPMLEAIQLPITKPVPLHDPEFGDQGEYYEANRGIHWCIVGAESGTKRRPMDVEWARSVRMQCEEAGIKFFMKQMEVNGKVTGEISQFPKDLQVREFPV